ncbi:MAG TPA: Uma2 family endonuclease [Isosphaeraceae bacterium]|jgi:Uma2 family endonuclease|nr:Uma2 family endonuclease [Isosphaeraceae bacterium]
MPTHDTRPQTRLLLGPDDHGRLVSDDEFAAADFVEPWKYERVKGRLAVMAPDGEAHDLASEPWRDRLGAYKLEHPDVVELVVSEAWVRDVAGTDRIGDIGVFLVAKLPVPARPDRVPELMFEVVSPDQESHDRDYVHKRADYHRLGVQEYVIIDRFERKVTVLTHEPGGYHERVLTLNDTYTSPQLPGLAIPMAEVMGP